MGHGGLDDDKLRDKACWRDILDAALSGRYAPEQPLERMPDHLEQAG